MKKIPPAFLFKALVKITLLQFILIIACIGITFSQNKNAKPPVYPPDTLGIAALKQSLEPVMKMSIVEVIAEVPPAATILYLGCPNCNGGSAEGERLRWHWEPGMGVTLRCNYCQMVFPNEKFPNNREQVIIAPSGARQVYRYYENPEGRQYYFEAHAWNIRSKRIQLIAGQLAKV